MKSGIDNSYIDHAVRVQDDLFRHFNGAWLASHDIPADRASDGVGYMLHEQAELQVRKIIESAPETDEGRKIGDLYQSFMETARIESLSHSPILGHLEEIDTIKNVEEFLQVLGKLEREGFGGIFTASVYTDHKDSLSNIIYLGQGGLSLPDEAYYREEQYQPIRDAFLAHAEKMFELVGITDGDVQAGRILTLETAIANCHWDQVKDRDATLTYNKFTRAQIEELAPGFNWAIWLHASEIAESSIAVTIVREPDFFRGVGKLLLQFDRHAWLSWLRWQVISGAAPYLNQALVHQNFSFYGTTLNGTPELRQRWKRAVSLIEGAIGEAVGRVYVEEHFPVESKTAMQNLVRNLVEAYNVSITQLDWMSEETKAKAIAKLSKFTPKIGYPDTWRDYSNLVIDSRDLMGNMARIAKFARDFELAKIGAPVDRSEWYMTPQTVNAYYNPGLNEIVFPAAILQPPFFDVEADDAANYGAIGAIIGHEIGHGFDDQGSKYDGDGNLSDWWKQSDRDEFNERARVLIAQFDALIPHEAPEITINGALTVGENIGDLGGLCIAHKAYQLSLGGTSAPLIDGLTGEQRFFYAWAQSWRSKIRPEALRQQIATDPHSPNEFRTNQVVRNMEAFYRAFGVKPGDGLYLEPGNRVSIW
jgi:putative endopeptidase